MKVSYAKRKKGGGYKIEDLDTIRIFVKNEHGDQIVIGDDNLQGILDAIDLIERMGKMFRIGGSSE